MRLIILKCLVLFLISCSAPAQDVSLEVRIDGLFAAYEAGKRPGYAIGVIREGELIFAKGYGYADIADAQKITPQTSFNLASLSKQFTAAAVALDIQSGRVTFDDPLANYWSDLPDFMQTITVGHLLYMTSGLPEYYSLPSPVGGWRSEDGFTVADAISAVFASDALNYTPGTRWTYSNINYQLLAELSARLNGLSFAVHMDKAIFSQLEMKDSWVDAPIQGFRPQRAASYVWSDEDNTWRVAPRLSPHYGGSGVFSSLEDLAKWDRALYHDDSLSEGFGKLMLSTRKYAHEKTNDALGLVHGSYQGVQTIWYEGGDYGVSTYMVHMPERDETVICLSNFGQGRCGDRARTIIDVLLAFEAP